MKSFRAVKTSEIVVGAEFFIPFTSKTWERVKVIDTDPEHGRCTVKCKESQEEKIIEPKQVRLMHANKDKDVDGKDLTEDDMTNLYHLNEPAIIENLEKRADLLNQRPYTRISNVLIAVNPLWYLPNPNVVDYTGERISNAAPHPWGMAETAFRQMVMAKKNKTGTNNTNPGLAPLSENRTNQSIVISGESGSGKTETAKIVLNYICQRSSLELNQHLAKMTIDTSEGNAVDAWSKSNGESSSVLPLDRQLMDSVPILEALGNAQTKRNPNSSRFGKLLKLEFAYTGPSTSTTLCGATIETYLLERSRVASHADRERNYHAMYQLLAGASVEELDELGLEHNSDTKFKYLRSSAGDDMTLQRPKSNLPKTKIIGTVIATGKVIGKDGDDKMYEEFKDAFVKCRLGSERDGAKASIEGNALKYFAGVRRGLAAVLHIGNIEFDGENAESMALIKIDDKNGDKNTALEAAAKALGCKSSELIDLLQRGPTRVLPNGEKIPSVNSEKEANKVRDDVAREIYSRMFNDVVAATGRSMETPEDVTTTGSIGVLDIFGFEYSENNGLEQLLINFANESLQGVFNNAVLKAEGELYREEGLEDSANIQESDFNGDSVKNTIGLINDIFTSLNESTLNLQSNEQSFFRGVNKRIEGSGQTKKNPTPDKTFTIAHYAANVKYTSGWFRTKNSYGVSAQMDGFLNASKLFKETLIYAERRNADEDEENSRPPKKETLASVFSIQMNDLCESLESTACHFIRCVKPNEGMKRGTFDREFVQNQMLAQGVPSTCEVLKRGMPSRILYSDIKERYFKRVLKTVEEKKKTLYENLDDRVITKAVLHTLNIPEEDYTMGKTRCFFRAGKIAMLDRLNGIEMDGTEGQEFVQKVVQKIDNIVAIARLLLKGDKKRLHGILYRYMTVGRGKPRLEYSKKTKKEREKIEKLLPDLFPAK
jgi:myosin heavy subunit